MTEFERAVLRILARAGEPLGWYQIERRLSTMTLAERPNLLDVLAELRRCGLVEQISAPVEPKVRHALTQAGGATVRLLGTQSMRSLELTSLAKVRIWFGEAMPGVAFSGSVRSRVESEAGARLTASQVRLEAFVPRGALVQYGLLGFVFEEERPATMLEVEVQYSGSDGVPWPESLAAQVDDVRRGLPIEYANPILEAATSFASHRFPPGRLRAVEAAHGLVGSSPEVFRRLTRGALTLMHRGPSEDEEVITLLKELLVG